MTLTNAYVVGCVLFAVYLAWTWVRDARDNRRRDLAWRKRVSEAAQAARDRIAAQAATPEPRPEPAWQPPPRPRPRPTPPPPPPWPPPPPDAASADAKAQQKIAALEALARSTTSDGERQAATNAAALLRAKHPLPPDAERAALEAALAALAAATAVYVSNMAGHRRGRKKRSSYR